MTTDRLPNALAFRGPTHHNKHECANAAHHRQAIKRVEFRRPGFALALATMLRGWELYADAHAERYEGKIGQDGVIGDYWAEVGLAIKRLLDGETGGLDCGSVAANILEQIDAQGIPNDGYCLNKSE